MTALIVIGLGMAPAANAQSSTDAYEWTDTIEGTYTIDSFEWNAFEWQWNWN